MLRWFLLLAFTSAHIQYSVDTIRRLWTKHVETQNSTEWPTCYDEYLCDINNLKEFGTFDFIIVGGADSAPVLARRLTENHKWKVLLLLIGEKEDDFASIPIINGRFKTADFGYLTTPQKFACQGMDNHQCTIILEKSQSPRNVYYIRPRKEDFDRWVKAGNTIWSFEENLPYFKKAEEMLVKKILKANNYHGTRGLMPVTNSETTQTLEKIVDAYKELSYPVLIDYNGGKFEGISKMQVHVRNGSRVTPMKAYLDPIIETRKSKLKVLYGAYTFQIIFDKQTKISRINFSYKNICYTASITKELILAGGAIISPHLLLLSGIGPAEELQKHGISLIANLPVGKNLMDNPTLTTLFKHSSCVPPSDLYSEFLKYAEGGGNLASPPEKLIAFHNILNTQGKMFSIKVTYSTQEIGYNPRLIEKSVNYDEKFGLDISGINPYDIAATFTVLRQRHRGYLALHSGDPFHHPKIDPGYFTDPNDLNDAYLAFEFVRNLLNTTVMKEIEAREASLHLCEMACTLRFKLNCVLSLMARPDSDPKGTNKMGCDASAVVNQNLLVHGVHGIRIVDSSVFPDSISGQTSTTEVMMAEKISDIIKNLHQKH